ncbi:substrate-binding periplasmic protein [Curvivirga aplysinae]|uniref:substrate-binding periplasmic protein n=1 Tax=Curvivirga aplysinae TaxID=2529852 RepID=UPI0012BBFB1B|nr:transporter substrate-binding domain-containing protein [Curvivirga aplysinae]MTI08247.1 transporter substrate-binding domain-containing protein [Curvivirga aplysinae]
MKYRYLLIFVISFIVTTGSIQAREVKLATTDWAPYFSDTLPEHGFFSAITDAAFKAVGHETNLTFLPWQRTLILAERGEYDGIMAAYYSDERAEVFHYSNIVYTDSVVLFAKKGFKPSKYTNLKDLVNFSIAVGTGWVYSPEFDSATYLRKEYAPNQIVNIRKLFYGRVDLMAASETVFQYEVSQHRSFEMDDFVKLDPPLAQNDLFLIFSKQLPDSVTLMNDFNRGLEIIKQNGELEKILNRFRM